MSCAEPCGCDESKLLRAELEEAKRLLLVADQIIKDATASHIALAALVLSQALADAPAP